MRRGQVFIEIFFCGVSGGGCAAGVLLLLLGATFLVLLVVGATFLVFAAD